MMKHLKKICVMLTLLLSLAAAPAFSQNSFYMANLDIEVGSSDEMQFILENENFFYGFQADITFPAGVNIKISELSLSDRFDKSYKLITNVSGRVLHIAVYSSPDSDSQTPIKENNGTLFTLPFDTAPNFFGGNVEISGIKFVSESDTDVNFPDVKSPIRVYPTSISLVPKVIDLFSGFQGLDTDTIEVNYTPTTGIIVKDVTWTSSDTTIADVDSTGIVTAKKDQEGQVTITATSPNNKTAKSTVNVINPTTGLKVRPKNILMEKGSTEEINAVLVLNSFPTSQKAPEIEYRLEDDDKGIIDISATETSNEDEPVPDEAKTRDIHKVKTFKIEGKKDGIAKLIVSCTDRGTEYKDTCEIEVKTYVKNIYIEPVGPLHIGDTVTMKYEIIPEDAPLNGIKWYSSDESIATIDINRGFLTAKKLGEVQITVTCPTFNGETSDSYTLKVVPIPAESITIKYKDDPDEPANPVESLEVMMQTTAQLIAEVMPVDTTDPTVTWASSHTEVAYVNAEGLITPYSLGKTEITATCGDVSATCKVTVTPLHVSKIKLDPTETELIIGNTLKISAKVLPEAATNKDLTWSSSDDAIATVDAEGTVTASALGDAIITATSVDTPKVTATCKVTVTPIPVESIALDRTTLFMDEGNTVVTLTTKILPEDATIKDVTWESSDSDVASVDNGTVTAGIPGTATITATSHNGKTATCQIKVPITVFDDGQLRFKVNPPSTEETEGTKVEVTGLTDGEAIKLEIPRKAQYAPLSKEFDVDAIAEEAFRDCSNLEELIIRNYITHIGRNPFGGCDKLTSIAFDFATPPAIEGVTFPVNSTIYVPNTSISQYNEEWKDGKGIINPIKGFVTLTAPTQPEVFSKDNPTFNIASHLIAVEGPAVWSTENAEIATVEDTGIVSMKYVGKTTISIESDGYSDSCEVTVNPQSGDANWDGVVDIADAVNIANYVVENDTELINWNPVDQWGAYDEKWTRTYWDGFYNVGSDINGESGISIADAVAVVEKVLEQPIAAISGRRLATTEELGADVDALVIGKVSSIGSNGIAIPVTLDNTKEYVALQADIMVPEGMTLVDVQAGKRAENHKLSARRYDDRSMKVILFNLSNVAFGDNNETVLELIVDGDMQEYEDISIFNIFASELSSASHELTSRNGNGLMGVEEVVTNAISINNSTDGLNIIKAKGEKVMVFSLDGSLVKTFVAASDNEYISLSKGIYLVAVGNKTIKAIVK